MRVLSIWPCGAGATQDENAPPGTRTPDPLIKSQQGKSKNLEKNEDSEKGAAHCAAVCAESLSADPDLQLILATWSELPQAIKAGIAAMVKAAKP